MVSIGDTAPAFTLTATDKSKVSLADHAGERVVLAFYPAAFTGVCTAEMCSFRDSMAALNNVGATVFGVSVDSPFANGAFAKENDIEFTLLSDVHRTMITDYGMTFENFVIDGYTVANRAVVIVEADGSVGYVWVCESLGQEPDYDAIVAHCSQ
ncbi:MAG: redoxin domain-containing protein [Candidatus Poseidonia sp.]|jgi:peroxiredoxin|nr:redoxin domain-containing protein [Poseidonia sp.]